MRGPDFRHMAGLGEDAARAIFGQLALVTGMPLTLASGGQAGSARLLLTTST